MCIYECVYICNVYVLFSVYILVYYVAVLCGYFASVEAIGVH